MKSIIVGAGGHGKVVLDVLQQTTDVIGFIDDDESLQNKKVNSIPVLGNFQSLPILLKKYNIDGAIVAIADNEKRENLYNKLGELNIKIINAIHSKAIISKNVEIGEGVMILAGVIINTNSKIGNCVILNTGSTIDHDNNIEDFVHISPGVNLGGNVSIGKYSHIGIGASIIQNINIGTNVTVGAGSVVVRDVPDNVVVAGVPAKVIKIKKVDENERPKEK